MNAIIGLCHFCDSHGPRTLFCTQAFKYNEIKKQASSTSTTSTSSSSSSSTSLSKNQQTLTSLSSIDILNRSESIIRQISGGETLAHDAANLSLSPQNRNHNHQETVNTTCKACRAFENSFHHYISYEKEKNICYVSQSTPSDSEVFALVRKACLRTLHCEVFEDSIYFDDDKDGSVIGYEFNIKDSEGRGMQRSYSLIIIMKDRVYLQQLMSFLSKQMALIAANIKKVTRINQLLISITFLTI
jgi:folliculin